ncbi:hypothetical protein Cantr_02336 [Candida viswanathii]|uniref:Uncharacterized protein n=1 Tax=Candida viswanathii TaxID=5486 RepID=A0A367YMT3_9ASCO|nr:hypothetical protein Cantr_02336 [Candida viswanathii]
MTSGLGGWGVTQYLGNECKKNDDTDEIRTRASYDSRNLWRSEEEIFRNLESTALDQLGHSAYLMEGVCKYFLTPRGFKH